MRNQNLIALSALAALYVAGCGGNHAGTYKGEATESGTVKISVPQTTNVAVNESPPRKLADQAVTITKGDGGYVIKFGECTLKGSESTPKAVVAKGDCSVKITNFEGKLPMSGMLEFEEGGALKMEVTATTKNDTTVINYEYDFKGSKQP
jgi:hypothetical protein